MWPVSQAFLDALGKGQTRKTIVTYTVPGGQPVAVRLKAGTVSLDESSRNRRTAQLTVFGGTSDYLNMVRPGCRFRVSHGLTLSSGTSNVDEIVPVFTGEISSSRQALGGAAGTIDLPLVDLNAWLTRAEFVVPFTLSGPTSRPAAIAAMVTDAMPGVVVNNISTDTGILGAAKVWTGSRVDAISAIASDGGLEAFFLPDGTYIIRDQPLISAPVTWTLRGLVEDGERQRPQDKLYNTVVVKPTATDGSQTWSQQVAQITDPNHPRHPSKIGVVPYILNSPTAASADAALRSGFIRLDRLQGTADTLNLNMLGNPALEGGDVLRVVIPATGDEKARIFQHAVSSGRLDLVTGGYDLGTRSAEVTNE